MRWTTMASAALLLALALPARADTLSDTLRELEREADTLTEETREALELLLPMLETVMDRLPMLMESIPAYEAPRILPNGDILIPRKRDLPRIDRKDDTDEPGLKT